MAFISLELLSMRSIEHPKAIGIGERTIVNLLQRDLSVLWQALLSSVRQHERLRLLWWSHGVIVLRKHCHGGNVWLGE